MRKVVGAAAGFSLVEVLIASGLLAGAVLTVAQLFASAIAATAGARGTSEAAVLAWQKVEELRSRAFTYDAGGAPITELTTAAGTLERDTPGFVDYVDDFGESLGGGATPPAGARYRRRWAVDGVSGDQVVVRARVLEIGRDRELAAVAALRTRTAP